MSSSCPLYLNTLWHATRPDPFVAVGCCGLLNCFITGVIVILCQGAFGRQQKMRDMGVDKLFQSMLMYSDPNLTEVYVY